MRLGKNSFSNFVRVRPIRASDLVQRKRKNKVLRGVKHHVSEGVGPSGPGDVVPPDEETRDCGGWSTTSVRAAAHPDLGTWCLRTKKQGFAGDEAPRQCRRRPIRTCGRGASPDPNPLFSRNERSRCTKCTAASFIYYAFFGVARSKAKPASPGSALVRSANSGGAHAARQRPSAPQARQCPRHTDEVC